jgi:hypothetical protein
MIKTFRGSLADGAQDTIVLHTNNGSTGYRIVKFDIMMNNFGSNRGSFIQVWKVSQDTVSTGEPTVDFSDQTLLGTAMQVYNATNLVLSGQTTFFDQEVFNQDIYITHTERSGGGGCNYYLELEQVSLDLSENSVATLKDIRNVKTQGF